MSHRALSTDRGDDLLPVPQALTVWSHQASSGLPFSVKHRGRGAAGLLHSGEADMEEEDREWNGPGEQRWLGSATWGQMALPTDVAAGIMSALVPEALSGARLVCRAWAGESAPPALPRNSRGAGRLVVSK